MIDRYGFKQIARNILGQEEKSFENDFMNVVMDTPRFSFDVISSFANERKIDKFDVEEMLYEWAKKYVQFMKSGRAHDKGIDEVSVDQNELYKGITVEQEHTPNEEMAKRIALDHLAEMPDYYTKLAQMEGTK